MQAAFTPPLTGSVSATLRMLLRIKGSGRTAVLSVAGASEAPRLCVEPAAIDLGAALLGERICARVSLRNPGTYPTQVHTSIKHARLSAAQNENLLYLSSFTVQW